MVPSSKHLLWDRTDKKLLFNIFTQNPKYEEEADVTAETDKPHPVHTSGACTKL